MNTGIHTGRIFIVEGQIGAGKSTFVRSTLKHAATIFGPATQVVVIREQVFMPMLEECLANPKNFALSFQVVMARDRLEVMREAVRRYRKGAVVLIDRGLPGDYVFAKHHHMEQNITDKQMDIYKGYLESAAPDFLPRALCAADFGEAKFHSQGSSDGEPVEFVQIEMNDAAKAAQEADGLSTKLLDPSHMKIVYLDVDPETAYGRMTSRNNKAEVDSYTLDFFKCLGGVYDEVIGAFREDWGEERIVTLDYRSQLQTQKEGGCLEAEQCQALWDEIVQK